MELSTPNVGSDNTIISSSPIMLGELQKDFFDLLRVQGKSANTLKNYRTDLECFNKYLIDKQGNLTLINFNNTKVMEYGAFLNQKYTSDNSRRRRVQALRIFFDFMVQKGLYSENPVRKLPTSPKFLDIPRPTPLQDVKTLWKHLCEDSKTKTKLGSLIARRNQVIVVLVYGGGLKVSDLAKLKMDHIYEGNEPRVMVTPTKRDPYSVPLPEIFNPVFASYKSLLDEVKRESNISFDEVLFNANPYRILSGGLSPRGLEIIFEELRNKLTITLTPKSLRQACIFKWLCQDKKHSLIKEWMGVTPSYSLKLYKSHLENNLFADEFLKEVYYQFEQ
jgi:site-specific recombinase XerD